jgi:hypothetical protein
MLKLLSEANCKRKEGKFKKCLVHLPLLAYDVKIGSGSRLSRLRMAIL